ncbi:MAG: cyanophycinase, partial [Candidatus Eremiobacteraeota bacterium]|nr:cyanophycinase [Candidatus Eremiobacteraeota bacterium]
MRYRQMQATMRSALVLPAAIAFLAATPVCAPTVYAPAGTYAPTAPLAGPGLLLAGGGDIVPAALVWMRHRLAAGSARSGNVVILRASSDNYDDALFYKEANFASVRTLVIPPCAQRLQIDGLARFVDRADAIFFAGGDQSHYTAWKGSALIAAVKHVYARGGIVGGSSAGLAIQGAVIFDSAAADRLGVETRTSDAIADPLEPRISFTADFFAWPALRDTITDTHFAKRNRFGRLVVFLARILRDRLLGKAQTIYGLGIDQGSAVVVDADGMATVFNGPSGRGAYLVRASLPAILAPGRPLLYTVEVSHVARSGERFNLLRKTTGEPWRSVT